MKKYSSFSSPEHGVCGLPEIWPEFSISVCAQYTRFQTGSNDTFPICIGDEHYLTRGGKKFLGNSLFRITPPLTPALTLTTTKARREPSAEGDANRTLIKLWVAIPQIGAPGAHIHQNAFCVR